jgi:hypothetical protein
MTDTRVHRVRRRQQGAGRLAAEHVLAVTRGQVIRGVRLAAEKLADLHGRREPSDARRQIPLERGHVEAVALAHVDERLRVRGRHGGVIIAQAS